VAVGGTGVAVGGIAVAVGGGGSVGFDSMTGAVVAAGEQALTINEAINRTNKVTVNGCFMASSFYVLYMFCT
jgi:hypothetical protein